MLRHLATLIRVILTVARPLTYVLFDFIGRILLGKKDMLPPIRSKILLMSATELADHIRKRKLTAEDVMKAYINRVKEVNPVITACVDERFEDAMADARAVDKMLKAGSLTEQQLATDLPLLGVPFSCKEVIGVKGMSQTCGLLSFKDRKSPSDAEVVTEYKKNGAIPFTVTNVPTLCMSWETSNLVFGITYNPYDKRRTCGGSSGGEAAILASAGSVIGIGTDIGGSIRMPAAFCGIYGHKPSRACFQSNSDSPSKPIRAILPGNVTQLSSDDSSVLVIGIVSNDRPWPNTNKNFDAFRSTGPMCRYVQDLRMLLRISSGKDAKKLKLDEKVDFTKVKIYYMEEMPGFLLSSTADTKAAVRKAVNHFRDKFGNIGIQLNLKELQYAFEMWQCKFIEADGPPIKSLMKHVKINWFRELVKWFFNRAEFDLPIILFALGEKGSKDQHYYKCLEMYDQLKKKLEDILSEDAIILLPTHQEPAPHIFTTVPRFQNTGYTCIFNTLGYPVTNLPAGMSHGVPIGLQAVAAQYNDHLTVATTEELYAVFRGWNSPCKIEV